jgi:hypothetical protein
MAEAPAEMRDIVLAVYPTENEGEVGELFRPACDFGVDRCPALGQGVGVDVVRVGGE